MQEEEEAKKKKSGPDDDGDCRGAAAALTYNRHTQSRTNARTHDCRRTTSEIPAPLSHAQKDPWRGSD